MHILNQLPVIDYALSNSEWGLTCNLMASLSNLKYLKLVITSASPGDYDYGSRNGPRNGDGPRDTRDYSYFLGPLAMLSRQSMDVDIHLRGNYFWKNYQYRSAEGEAIWTDLDGEGDLSSYLDNVYLAVEQYGDLLDDTMFLDHDDPRIAKYRKEAYESQEEIRKIISRSVRYIRRL
ncbi:uncharacterized protein N0V89_005281 [Didymosphaeria variabile]|uniref:Uncharacterized protein n=1 Tax=Didymosphaeria variabile TaxID=1932322 RepID=A0A9W8XKR5_9PLEO|nr:uncharacterized protein N0V89_005281 [Didymosphaeria variabile]KAJ4353551.1 hypothetical protein N0V89_005281 [Didymosphaeria variabile]